MLAVQSINRLFVCEDVVPDAASPIRPETPPGVAPGRRRKRRAKPPLPAVPRARPQRPSPALLESLLRAHVLPPERLCDLGYPIEMSPSQAVVYLSPPPRARPFTAFDVNAPEFVPGAGFSPGDSGRSSGGSSPRSDSDEEAPPIPSDAEEQRCARCDSRFFMRDREYLTRDRCLYHWGRAPEGLYTCCGTPSGSRGCTTARLHVWSGTKVGMNGPLDGYVRARTKRGGVLALDAEMCYTTAGLELARLAVVGVDGRLVYSASVRPSATIVDCNTRFSGIRSRDIERATKTLRDVQNDILGFIGSDTIIVGHALDNDMRALKLVHACVVDTSALFPHWRGLPWRRSLRALAATHLHRTVQESCHSPVEDARTALDLALLRVQEDLVAAAADC